MPKTLCLRVEKPKIPAITAKFRAKTACFSVKKPVFIFFRSIGESAILGAREVFLETQSAVPLSGHEREHGPERQ